MICKTDKSLPKDFHSKGKRHESICKSCSNQRKRRARNSAKTKACVQREPEQGLANPNQETVPVTGPEPDISPEANSGDPWAFFDKICEEPPALHEREHIRQNLKDFFQTLSEMRNDVAQEVINELERNT